MSLKVLGYDFSSSGPVRANGKVLEQGSGNDVRKYEPPARVVYVNSEGDHFVALPTDDGVVALPFIPGSPAEGKQGPPGSTSGFVPVEKMPAPPSNAGGASDVLGGMLSQLPTQVAVNWLGPAAMQSIVAGGCGGMTDGALKALGLDNPLGKGPLANVLAAALQKAGVGELGSLLPSAGAALMGGSTAGLADAMGTQGVNSLLSAAGLDKIPGAGLLANALGDKIGDQLQNMFTGGLDKLTDSLGNLLSGVSADSIAADVEDAIKNIDPAAITSQGLDLSEDQLMSQWKVDDESSAAEHIANKAVTDNMGNLKAAAKDPSGTIDKIKKFFNGEALSPGKPAVRMTDLDDGADISMMGVATILFEKLPVSRITDTVVGPKSPAPKPIIEGAATVLSAELPTAFVSGKTAVPSVLVKGAGTIFVGGAIAAISPPAVSAKPNVAGNKAPAAPKAAGATSSGSTANGQEGEGENKPAVPPLEKSSGPSGEQAPNSPQATSPTLPADESSPTSEPKASSLDELLGMGSPPENQSRMPDEQDNNSESSQGNLEPIAAPNTSGQKEPDQDVKDDDLPGQMTDVEDYHNRLRNAKDFKEAVEIAKKENNSILEDAKNDISDLRREDYDKQFKALGKTYDQMTRDEKASLYDPKLTHADAYLQAYQDTVNCGPDVAAQKVAAYVAIKKLQEATDQVNSTDNDRNMPSLATMDQVKAGLAGVQDAKADGHTEAKDIEQCRKDLGKQVPRVFDGKDEE